MNLIQKIALVFTIIGAINWGLIGLFNFNLVESIFGTSMLSAIIYMIVGIAGIINIMLLFTDLDQEINVINNGHHNIWYVMETRYKKSNDHN